ncbi:MAG: hypothetical protein ABJA71_03110 [Ginsengibacter sp.]
MQDNKYSSPQGTQDEVNSNRLSELQHENRRLLLENAQLKNSLEKEEFLHKNLYKQWTELNASVLIKNRELKKLKLRHKFWRGSYRYVFYALLLIIVVFTYYLLSIWGKNSASLQIPGKNDTLIRAAMQVQMPQTLPAKNIKPEKNDTALPQAKQAVNNNGSLQIKTPEISNNSIRYRVKTKAFFYNQPDENAQRNTFLLPYGNSYGIVTAVDNKNDFVYVIYTNHAGRTSKGWIRKIDLNTVHQ